MSASRAPGQTAFRKLSAAAAEGTFMGGAGCGQPAPSRPTSASLPRKGTWGAVFVVLTCEWELCPQPPRWRPPAGARAAVGQPWSAFAGLGVQRGGGRYS